MDVMYGLIARDVESFHQVGAVHMILPKQAELNEFHPIGNAPAEIMCLIDQDPSPQRSCIWASPKTVHNLSASENRLIQATDTRRYPRCSKVDQ